MRFALLAITVVGLSIGCNKEEKNPYAKVSVAFANDTTLALAETKPTGLKMRLKMANITQDREYAADGTWQNKGEGAMIWGCAQCVSMWKDDDSDAFTINVKSDDEADAAGAGYFDLNRPSAEVNTELNSQDAKVLPGTYRYLAMALIGEQQGSNNGFENTKWSYTTEGVAEKAYASIVTEWSGKIDPPLELAEGQSVVITLSYSLDKVVTTGLTNAESKVRGSGTIQPGKYDDCNVEKTICMNFPTLTISASSK